MIAAYGNGPHQEHDAQRKKTSQAEEIDCINSRHHGLYLQIE
jgi:hypothetical protein